MPFDRFSLVPAAYVLLRRRKHGVRQVFLQLRSGTGFMDGHWACGAAGHVEAGESVFAAACREAREELGVAVSADELVPLCTVHRRHEDADPLNQRVDFFFAVDHWEGDPELQERDKAAGSGWFDLLHLPEPIVPHELRVLEGLRSGDLPHLAANGFEA